MINKIVCLGLSLIVAVSLFGCSKKTDTKTAIYFDTVVTLSAEGEIPKDAFSLLDKYDKLFSATNKDSQVYKLNKLGELEVDSELSFLIKEANKYSQLSGGRFDITVYPLKKVWGFSDTPKVPKTSEITEALKKVGYGNIKLENGKVTLKNGAKIDLGGIAKGYIADKLSELYIKEGKSGIINLGGNIMLPKAQKEPYKIGITDPDNTESSIATILVDSGAVVTSGTYQRSFEELGKTYHHILDTKTGYPANTGIVSVTILARSSTAADALSTAVLCMGKTEGLNLINSLENTEAVIITDKGEILLSNGLSQNGKEIIKE